MTPAASGPIEFLHPNVTCLWTAAVLGCLLPGCERTPPPVPAPCSIEPPAHPLNVELERPPPPPHVASLMEKAEKKVAMASWIVADRRHRWSPGTHTIETVDGSLVLHAVARSAREATRYRVQVAVLVDYAPAPAKLTLWSGDRKTRLDTVKGTGTWREQESDAIAVDVELPAGTLPLGRWSDVQTVLEIAPIDQLDSSDADVRRWTVHAGSSPPPPVRCSVASTTEPPSAITRLRSAGVASTYAIPVPTPSDWPTNRDTPFEELKPAFEIDAGEELAVVALAGGKPLDPLTFVRSSKTGGTVVLDPVNVATEGPVFVVAWRNPFVPDQGGATNFRSSNVLWRRQP